MVSFLVTSILGGASTAAALTALAVMAGGVLFERDTCTALVLRNSVLGLGARTLQGEAVSN